MKITVDVDMTPQEARQFMGLPDVAPMQASAMAELEKRMKVEMDRISPEGLLKTWFVDAPQTADRMMKMFTGLLGAAVPKSTEPAKPAEPPKS